MAQLQRSKRSNVPKIWRNVRRNATTRIPIRKTRNATTTSTRRWIRTTSSSTGTTATTSRTTSTTTSTRTTTSTTSTRTAATRRMATMRKKAQMPSSSPSSFQTHVRQRRFTTMWKGTMGKTTTTSTMWRRSMG